MSAEVFNDREEWDIFNSIALPDHDQRFNSLIAIGSAGLSGFDGLDKGEDWLQAFSAHLFRIGGM